MIVQLGNGKWKADFWLGPKRIRKTLGNKKLLEQYVTKKKFEFQQGLVTGKKAEGPTYTFRDAVNDYERLYVIPNGKTSWPGFYTQIEQFFGSITPLKSITALRIKEWRSGMLDKHPMATVKRRYAVLFGIFREAAISGHIDVNPCIGLFRRQWKKLHNPRLRWFTDQETQAVYQAIKDPQMLSYAVLARNTGFRENNLTQLEWTDVSFAQKTVRARDTKNDESYTVNMNPSAEKALLGLWNTQGHPASGRVFRGGVSNEYWNNKFRKLFDGMKFNKPGMTRQQRATLHTFRHTFCSKMVMAGYNEQTIVKAMGWKSSAQLRTYAHLAPDYMQRAVNDVDCGPLTNASFASKESVEKIALS